MTYGQGYGDEAIRLFTKYNAVDWQPVKDSKIVDFFTGKNVFVTGATGFLGKLVVEKILRACPDVETIFILVRCKRGKGEMDRIDTLYSDKIFEPLSKIFPKFQHKIRLIKGDVSAPNLGLSPVDSLLLQQKTNIIFHIAATVRFDEKMPLAINTNVRGTRDILLLAKNCPHLQSFVHVSTAYANSNQPKIEEKLYDLPITADELIEMSETRPEQELLDDTPKMIRDWPNTYTFTKAIAEDAVKVYGQGLPVCIYRPSIVIATYKEPLRSWIDNLYGATGICVGAGTGVLKSLHCDEMKAAEVVPADYLINGMLAAAYKTAVDHNVDEIPVYNYVSGPENRLSWRDFMYWSQLYGCEIPSVRCIWYYSLTLNRYKWVHLLYVAFFHFLPAILMDAGMILTGRKPMMYKVYKKINKFESVIEHFSTNEWNFYNDNVRKLWQSLDEPDRKMFPFSMRELDWKDYFKTHLLGLRVYLVKDPLETMEAGRKLWAKFYVAHIVVKLLFYLFIGRILYYFLSLIF